VIDAAVLTALKYVDICELVPRDCNANAFTRGCLHGSLPEPPARLDSLGSEGAPLFARWVEDPLAGRLVVFVCGLYSGLYISVYVRAPSEEV
jgi:hypothetical protein